MRWVSANREDQCALAILLLWAIPAIRPTCAEVGLADAKRKQEVAARL